MLSSSDLQIAYNHLYEELRNYIWDVDTVIDIAELETAVYKAFPTHSEVICKFTKLVEDTDQCVRESEELRNAFREFQDTLYSDTSWYLDLPTAVASNQIQEDINNETY